MSVTIRGMVSAFIAARGLSGHPSVNYLHEFADFVQAAISAGADMPEAKILDKGQSLSVRLIRELLRVTELQRQYKKITGIDAMMAVNVLEQAIEYARAAMKDGSPEMLRAALEKMESVK